MRGAAGAGAGPRLRAGHCGRRRCRRQPAERGDGAAAGPLKVPQLRFNGVTLCTAMTCVRTVLATIRQRQSADRPWSLGPVTPRAAAGVARRRGGGGAGHATRAAARAAAGGSVRGPRLPACAVRVSSLHVPGRSFGNIGQRCPNAVAFCSQNFYHAADNSDPNRRYEGLQRNGYHMDSGSTKRRWAGGLLYLAHTPPATGAVTAAH